MRATDGAARPCCLAANARGHPARQFHGFPASGREIVWRDMVTSRFRDDLIAEDWAISDLAERLLGAKKS